MADVATVKSPTAPETAEEVFELELTEEDAALVVVDEVVAEEEPEAAKDAEPKPKAEPVAEVPKPEPEVAEPKAAKQAEEPPKKRLDPIAREEREKRKHYAQLWAETAERLDAVEAENASLRARVGRAAVDDPNLKEHVAKLRERADKSQTMGELAEVLLEEFDRRDRAASNEVGQVAVEVDRAIYSLRCEVAEVRARVRHDDYDAVVGNSGLLGELRSVKGADGKEVFANPRIARKVYWTDDGKLAADPAERLYRLAVGKVEYERAQRGETDEEPEPVQAKPEGKPAVPEAEAERRGARRVIEQVERAATRPRGIKGIRKAGGPVGFTRAQLDLMMEQNPERYQALMKTHPDLERFHLGG